MSQPFNIFQIIKDSNLEACAKITIELLVTKTYSEPTKAIVNNYLAASIYFQETLINLSNLAKLTNSRKITALTTEITESKEEKYFVSKQ
jgi:tRNA(Phe) wybutosine-synthesizing methylase Tyw3